MELLAPAGNTENFIAAMDAGADAVYVGAPGFNARNLARDLRLEEIFAMVRHCHDHDKKIYLAANSLVREQDIHSTLKTLSLLEMMETDGLIVQDLGLVRLINQFFPDIPLHASTLLSANNSLALQGFHDMGFERVVLARELTLKEIHSLCQSSPVEIEVFVHGAMCFSYSGLCLFSSFLGGKSGLRGKCVQPCRRHYQWNSQKGAGSKKKKRNTQQKASSGKGQYVFSMNDLSALEAVPDLIQAGVSSLKIEGRLRSAHYVSSIVQAYRLMIDAEPEQFTEVLAEAEELSKRAMGRKTSSGYFYSPQPLQAITPYHSGNMGDFLGRLGAVKAYKGRLYARLTVKETLNCGDRLRLHAEPSGERLSFTLKEIRLNNIETATAATGSKVQIHLPEWEFYKDAKRIDVFRVDVKKEAGAGFSLTKSIHSCAAAIAKIEDSIRQRVSDVERVILPEDESERVERKTTVRHGLHQGYQNRGGKIKLPIEGWLRFDHAKSLFAKLPFNPGRYLLPITRANMSQTGQLKRYLGKRSRDLIWCLPPVVFEGELQKLQKQVQLLIRSGFRSFQLGHISQVVFFERERVFLSTDYTVSLLNSQSVRMVADGGIESAQLSIESDKTIIHNILNHCKTNQISIKLGLTVYGAPALFTARLDSDHFQYTKSLKSPKNEQFMILKKENVTATVPLRPFSLLPYLHELKSAGLQYVVIDMSNMAVGMKEMEDLASRLSGKGSVSKLPTFNYLGELE